ncbi:pectate lyase [Halopelagius fulvigenes]|uniref:Pectate lyase n=1 Tax=Halopelagius fulvigenes TaxID=1198324 RepID=A0ABD5TXN4_9EURY
MSQDSTQHGERSDSVGRTISRRGALALTGGLVVGSALTGTAAADSSETVVTPGEPLGTVSPSSPIDPVDGFADTDWTAGTDLSVVKVTNLDATGEGSFKHAMERDVEGDGRIVVFEVGGVIDLSEASGELDPEANNMFVAGQTAPGPGITLIKGTFEIDGENVVVQHIRSRAGTQTAPGASGEGDAADSITIADESKNVIVDHCTATWGTDENLSCGDTASDITFSNNLIAHGLAAPNLHPDGDEHSNGSLVGHDTEGMAILGNLYAHNNDRNPRLKGGTRSIVANNVVYNYDTAVRLGDDAESNAGEEFPTQVSLIRNVYRPGDNTPLDDPVVGLNQEDDVLKALVYLKENVTQGPVEMLSENPDERLVVADEPPVLPSGFDAPKGTFANVLNAVSARPARRISYDESIVQQTKAKEGEVIDQEDEVGGYPDFGPVTRQLDVPTDGFGEWLAGHTEAVER